jgi:hypothetical protein
MYQTVLDRFYDYKPFRLVDVERVKDGQSCECCGNRHLKALCIIRNPEGRFWRIGRECWSNIEQRQFQENVFYPADKWQDEKRIERQ